MAFLPNCRSRVSDMYLLLGMYIQGRLILDQRPHQILNFSLVADSLRVVGQCVGLKIEVCSFSCKVRCSCGGWFFGVLGGFGAGLVVLLPTFSPVNLRPSEHERM